MEKLVCDLQGDTNAGGCLCDVLHKEFQTICLGNASIIGRVVPVHIDELDRSSRLEATCFDQSGENGRAFQYIPFTLTQ